MMRLCLFLALTLFSLQARCDDCYYYWEHQCIKITDAGQRALRQYVLLSPSINYLSSQDGQSCDAAVAEKQSPVNAQLLERFNNAASRIKTCQTPITELKARVYDKPGMATWHYDRSRKERPGKTVVMVSPLPVL
ncbi:MAG: hypothetical protein R3292_05610 [Alcanivorax sp.]|nr:hypothetical protein [Alcanivorax sp.]